MITEWLNASELSSAGLPGLPETKFGIQKKAARDGWKSRPRVARGGGIEYHISSLPKEAQIAYVESLIVNKAALKSSSAQYHAVDTSTDREFSSDDRRNAKILIVKLFERYRGATTLGILEAEKPFMKFYEAERQSESSEFLPSWVFDVHPTFSVQSLRRWRSLRNEENALVALAGRYGNRKGSGVLERALKGELKNYILALVLKQPHLTGGHVRDLCRAKFGEFVSVKDSEGNEEQKELPTVRTFERFILNWKAENQGIHLRLTNPDAHKNRTQLALGKADAGITRLNQLWEIDASPADVLCMDGRYSLYGIIDVYSRRVIYSVTKTARTEAALLLIRRAIMEWGVPETIRTDNGSDFTSQRFMNALISLHIDQDVCPPFSGEKKPFIERSFHTLQHDLMPLLPGYIGHSVKDRKEIESRRAFASRLGENDAKAFAVELDHTKLQEHIDLWVKARYMPKAHSGLNGVSPFAKAAAWTAPVKKIENHRALDLLLAPVADQGGFRTVGKKGIRLDGGHFFSSGLAAYVGQRVYIRCNPEDMGVIYCFSEDGAYIAEAKCFEREGVHSVEAAAKAKAVQKEFDRERIEPLRREMKKITPAKMAEEFLSLHNRENGNVTIMPGHSEAYNTPALAEAARAMSSPYSPRNADPQQASLERLEKEFTEKSPAKPTPASDEDRWWIKACALEARENSGERLSDADAKWLQWAMTTYWYQAKKDFELMCENPG